MADAEVIVPEEGAKEATIPTWIQQGYAGYRRQLGLDSAGSGPCLLDNDQVLGPSKDRRRSLVGHLAVLSGRRHDLT